jgi:hypothetical protein
MKTDFHRPFTGTSPQERPILDQIRDDHELVARLSITPQELDALSKCAFLGTLTCKEDMLFILRQIREATSPLVSERILLFSQPAPYSEDEEQEDLLPDFRQIQSRFAPEIIPQPGSLERPVRLRLPKQFGVLFLVTIMAVALLWNEIITISRWRGTFITRAGLPVTQAPALEVWSNHLNRFGVLLSSEILFVVGITGVIYFRSLRGRSRFRVRPSCRY